MRTTLNLDEELLRDAQEITQIKGKTAVVHAGLKALIAREAARQLAEMGGKDPRAEVGRRRPQCLAAGKVNRWVTPGS